LKGRRGGALLLLGDQLLHVIDSLLNLRAVLGPGFGLQVAAVEKRGALGVLVLPV
jgi:hypothetical protein